MEIQAQKQYQFDNVKISICRHFREKTSPEDVIKNAVIKTYKQPEFLTATCSNDIIQITPREPICQIRRSDKQQ